MVPSAALSVPALLVPAGSSRSLLPALPAAFFVAGERIVASIPLRAAPRLTLPVVDVHAGETKPAPGDRAPCGPLYRLRHRPGDARLSRRCNTARPFVDNAVTPRAL